eukprot:2583394-Alexandrium_andersonii.AAC.1
MSEVSRKPRKSSCGNRVQKANLQHASHYKGGSETNPGTNPATTAQACVMSVDPEPEGIPKQLAPDSPRTNSPVGRHTSLESPWQLCFRVS